MYPRLILFYLVTLQSLHAMEHGNDYINRLPKEIGKEIMHHLICANDPLQCFESFKSLFALKQTSKNWHDLVNSFYAKKLSLEREQLKKNATATPLFPENDTYWLYDAMQKDLLFFVHYFLNNYPDPEVPDSERYGILVTTALSYDALAVTNLLLSKKFIIKDTYLLSRAIEKGYTNLAKKLIKLGAPLECHVSYHTIQDETFDIEMSALHAARANRNKDLVNFIIEYSKQPA